MPGKEIERLRDAIISSMRDYVRSGPSMPEVDVNIDASAEIQSMLHVLQSDELPLFGVRFKALLNQNTIREIAGFPSHSSANARPSASVPTRSTDRCARSTTSPIATLPWKWHWARMPTCAIFGKACAPVPKGADWIVRRGVHGNDVLARAAHYRTFPWTRRQRGDGQALDSQDNGRAQLVRFPGLRTLARMNTKPMPATSRAARPIPYCRRTWPYLRLRQPVRPPWGAVQGSPALDRLSGWRKSA
jgi:hypothetical protein